MHTYWIQSIGANIVSGVLMLIAGIVIGMWRKHKEEWASPVLYGLATIACLLIVWYVATGRSILSPAPQKITADNLAENLKAWAYGVGIDMQYQDVPDAYFGDVARLNGGDPVIVFRSKDKPDYLQFQSVIAFAPEHQIAIQKLNQEQATRFVQQITIDSLRGLDSEISFIIGVSTNKGGQSAVTLDKGVLITTLDQTAFIGNFDEITRATEMVRLAVQVQVR